MKLYIKSLLLLLLILSSSPLYARLRGQPLIDSLLKELPKAKEDTNKVKLLGSLITVYRSVDPDEGIKYGQQAIDLAAKLKWGLGKASAYNGLGANYLTKSDFSKALLYFQEALKTDEELGYKKGIAISLGNIGAAYQYQGDYPNALEYIFRALKIHEETGNKNGIALAYENMGGIYSVQGDGAKALEYDLKALKAFEELGNEDNAAGVTANIGGIYQNQGDYASALEYDFKALKMAEDAGNKQYIGAVTGNIGEVYKLQHNYAQAVAWFFKAVQMDEETGDKNNEAAVLTDIGTAYIGLVTCPANLADNGKMTTVGEIGAAPYNPDSLIPKGRNALLHKAVEYLNKAIEIDKKTGSLDYLQQTYWYLSTADSLLDDYKGAYFAHILYIIFKDSVFSKEDAVKIAKLELKRKIETDSLKSEHARSIAELKYRQQRVYTYLGIAGIILLIGFSFFISGERGKSERERKKSDALLLNILPTEVAAELKMQGSSEAKHFENVTVLFTDFVNFTEASERMNPQRLIDELHTCFKTFDAITEKYNVEKIKTIGDAYLAVAGLPTADPLHAEHIVRAAIDINAFMQDRIAKLGNSTFEIRIGIHSGSVVAGIVGVKKFAYDIWGDTVNTAARMEQNSEAGKINISATTYELVKDKFRCEYRGEIDAKGKGMLKMYFLKNEGKPL